MTIIENKTIGEIVAEDYRTAQVFKNHNIDFCCKGNRSIKEACEPLNIDPTSIMTEIDGIQKAAAEGATDYKTWPLDLLADYIEKKHHRYVEEQVPVLKQYLDKLCRVHGNRHPELAEINEHFKATAGELITHMKKEELVLFPFIRKMVNTAPGTEMRQPYFGSVKNPVNMMMDDHAAEGERFQKIAALSDNYTTPADGCNTYQVTYALLKEFEEDLHLHIHLENNILFPKAIDLEKKING